MFSLSSPLALKGQLKPSTATTVLLVVFILTLYITSCKARQLHVHDGKDYSGKLPSSPPKGVIDGGTAKGKKTRSSPEVPVGSNIDASMGNETVIGAKKEMTSSGDSCRGSLRERFDGIKVRSMRERSVLGAESNSEQVGSNTTTAYTAETLVAMDYLDAHPAPAVHNR
ncbi:hypothetical protein BAE44_0021250 [Dichanthelium oligosanthes]|uniref:Uncharacterized protein n=1 Tax=Dichanthelium oligosanthes TaxID=888268 RepID=A0A1E5UXY2_9POAL|nr:hypothetical protein BAE44_0021250 [Dichanthelium oligosanthes]